MGKLLQKTKLGGDADCNFQGAPRIQTCLLHWVQGDSGTKCLQVSLNIPGGNQKTPFSHELTYHLYTWPVCLLTWLFKSPSAYHLSMWQWKTAIARGHGGLTWWRGGNNIIFNRATVSLTACSSSFTPLLLDTAFSGCGLKADFIYPGEQNDLNFFQPPWSSSRFILRQGENLILTFWKQMSLLHPGNFQIWHIHQFSFLTNIWQNVTVKTF